ncbi:MAG: ABC transporter ATP-binding protein [Nitrospirota bacterium]|nr:MAG: ABC transporter ATP-binding protein [Nitrospirota bacterium]
MENILSLESISYRHQEEIVALDNVSVKVKEGEMFAVIGANGSGKSTLLQIMNGLLHPMSGNVTFRGAQITEETLKDRGFLKYFRTRVGFVFQDSDVQLFCPTVLDELLYGPLQLEIAEEEAMERASEVMKMLNIDGLKDRPSYMLSGGEKKRVAIGSVLTMNPEVLLLDEPTNGLDPRTECFLVELMLDLSEAGKTLVIATHDLSIVDELNARTALLSEEHTIEKIGPSDEILRDEELLLRANLIHEHVHYHGKTQHKHRHSHYFSHDH